MLWPACFITQDPLAARQAVDVSATSTHNTPAMSSPSQGTVATSKTTWPRHRPTGVELWVTPGWTRWVGHQWRNIPRSTVLSRRLSLLLAEVLSLSVLLRQSAVQGTQPMAYCWRARVFPLPPLSPLSEIRCCLGWLRTSLELAA